jgi:formate-dependent nitrite reductase cytochrome c552 subunit
VRNPLRVGLAAALAASVTLLLAQAAINDDVEDQRRAQFYLDFVEAENSTGFHAPQEAARILGESLNYARQGQIALRDPGFKPTVPVVEIPNK